MRPPIILSISWVALLSSMVLPAQQPAAPTGFGGHVLPKHPVAPTADSTTDDQLRARQSSERFGGLTPADKEPQTHDLVSSSTFLQSDGLFTLVPKGAVLHTPENLAFLVVESPTGKAQAWPDFLMANRGRVTTFEVTWEQAIGKVPLDPEKFQLVRKGGSLIVAVCKGGPISVAAGAVPPPPVKPTQLK